MKYISPSKQIKFLQALGVPTEDLKAVDIRMRPDELVTITCTYYAGIEDGDIQWLERTFYCVERDEDTNA